MELHEKLQELRKSRGLTQEELAEALYVSRTAVSKWEQGRGYPSLDSLRELSKFFSVSIDDLLSGDALLSIAEKDNQSNLCKAYDMLLSLTDLFSAAFIALPLYPERVDGFVYSVTLWEYDDISVGKLCIYWILFILPVVLGALKLFLLKIKSEKNTHSVSDICTCINVLALFFLVISREAYAAALMVMLLVVKMLLLGKISKA